MSKSEKQLKKMLNNKRNNGVKNKKLVVIKDNNNNLSKVYLNVTRLGLFDALFKKLNIEDVPYVILSHPFLTPEQNIYLICKSSEQNIIRLSDLSFVVFIHVPEDEKFISMTEEGLSDIKYVFEMEKFVDSPEYSEIKPALDVVSNLLIKLDENNRKYKDTSD